MIHHSFKSTVGYRAKMTVALVHDWSRTVDVLETINSKSIIGISKQGPVLSNNFNVVASGCFVVMVNWSRSNRGSHMTTTQQRNDRCIHIVALSFTWPFDVHTIEV